MSFSDDVLNGFKQLEYDTDIGKSKLAPAIVFSSYNLATEYSYYRPQQFLDALNLTLALYPGATWILLNLGGRNFAPACSVAAEVVTHIRERYGFAA